MGTKATTELLPRQPHDPTHGRRSISGRTEEEQSPREKPQKPYPGPSRQGRARRWKGKTKSQAAASPRPQAKPCCSQQPWATSCLAGATAWGPAHWEMDVGPRQWPVAEEGPWGHPNLSVRLSTATRSSSHKLGNSNPSGLCCLHACKVLEAVRSAFSLSHPNSALI